MKRVGFREVWARYRQWTFPAAYRLRWSDRYDPVERMGLLLNRGGTEAVDREDTEEGEPSEAFLVALGNQLFRMQQSADEIDGGSRARRNINRNIKRMRDLLGERRVEIFDLKGQAYDVSRRDFEPLAEAETRPELDGPTILFCQTPSIHLDGHLVQPAKGVVGVPPGPEND